jgi:autotransporter-associated beta strand protein
LGTGTYSLGDATTAPAAAINVSANTDLSGANAVANPLLVNRNFTISGSFPLEFSGDVTLATTTVSTLTVSNTAATILSGDIGGTGFGIAKAGAGTLTLTGSSSYDGGTTVSAGTLLANNTTGSAMGTGAVAITGGKLGGTGSVAGAVSINSGGTIAPGNSIESIDTGDQTWNNGGNYEWEIASATGTAGTDWDLINITGTLDVAADNVTKFTIKIISSAAVTNWLPNVYREWVIATTTGGVTNFAADKFILDVTGFTDDGNTVGSPGFGLYVSGNNLKLTYVPEPGTASLLAIGTAGLLRRRRRAS